jgi:methionine-rich copper-binding protein CopC
MDRRIFVVGAGSASFFAPPQAYARMGVLLVRAEPGVGLTVTSPVRELRLYFDQGVLVASSSVQVTNSAGVTVPATAPTGDPSGQQIVIVHFGRVLLPGTYRVSWHVVSVDQRPASGAFRFTVS